jgi:transcriptional regulator with XRE-family HTH domain
MMHGGSGDRSARTVFAALVRRSRHAAWMTQEELAEKSGLSPRTIQAIERGQVSRPHRESVRLLADALDLHGMARAEFELVARGGARPDAGCETHQCPPLAELARCMARRVGTAGTDVDLQGLGPTADPATVLARLLRALGVEVPGYGVTGSLVPNQTLPAQALPGA